MANNISVSVVMPVYNCEKYVADAVESVLRQNVSLELIIVNDNSTDNTLSVIDSYKQDSRIRIINNTDNMGAAWSRNTAVNSADGDYIAFLDGDDYWTDDKLERQLKFMKDNKAVLSSTARELIDENGDKLGIFISIPEKVTYKMLLKGNVLNTSGVMVDAQIARKYPMMQEHLHEDYIMWLSILREYGQAYGLNEPLLKYRIMKGTKSANKFKSAKMTYGVYRYMGIGRLQSLYYFCCYAVKGVLKYSGLAK